MPLPEEGGDRRCAEPCQFAQSAHEPNSPPSDSPGHNLVRGSNGFYVFASKFYRSIWVEGRVFQYR